MFGLDPCNFFFIKSVSLKIEPLQYIAIYHNGSIFNETDFTNTFRVKNYDKMVILNATGTYY